MRASVISVNVASRVHEGEWTGKKGKTGIDKRQVIGPVRLANDGVEGDVVVDTKVHGGYDQAVYAYAREDADWWSHELGSDITNGKFGENLTTQGIDVTNAFIGERWRIGEVILEVSQPRIPCRVFAGFWQRPTLIKDFTAAKRPGAYLRIMQEGSISAGDYIEIIERPTHGVSVKDLFEAKSGNRIKLRNIAAVSQLSSEWREWVEKVIASGV